MKAFWNSMNWYLENEKFEMKKICEWKITIIVKDLLFASDTFCSKFCFPVTYVCTESYWRYETKEELLSFFLTLLAISYLVCHLGFLILNILVSHSYWIRLLRLKYLVKLKWIFLNANVRQFEMRLILFKSKTRNSKDNKWCHGFSKKLRFLNKSPFYDWKSRLVPT